MSVYSGPEIITNGLVLALDAANAKSALRKKQTSNIIPDPNTWTLGNGGLTGYGANGTAAEQLRAYVTDDPWGGNSIVWRTVPDGLSEADGGWNSGYYAIDRSFTYRWSVWVRRHTAGTGGTFYFGMNPAPIRNDTGVSQANPYFNFPAQASLTLNQWYLVVGHCFYESYSGGRHPDSGWYANGVKISDIGFGNVGEQDVRWDPSTTTAMHRTYHYYTTNTASGLEFAYPRLDKCDGTQPSIQELLNVGESRFRDVSRNSTDGFFYNGVGYDYNNGGSSTFDGSNDGIIITSTAPLSLNTMTISSWNKATDYNQNGFMFEKTTNNAVNTQYSLFYAGAYIIYRTYGLSTVDLAYLWSGQNTLINGQWNNVVATFDGTYKRIYVNGNLVATSSALTGTITQNTTGYAYIGAYGNLAGYYFNGNIADTKVYNRALTATEIQQNFNALRGRFGV